MNEFVFSRINYEYSFTKKQLIRLQNKSSDNDVLFLVKKELENMNATKKKLKNLSLIVSLIVSAAVVAAFGLFISSHSLSPSTRSFLRGTYWVNNITDHEDNIGFIINNSIFVYHNDTIGTDSVNNGNNFGYGINKPTNMVNNSKKSFNNGGRDGCILLINSETKNDTYIGGKNTKWVKNVTGGGDNIDDKPIGVVDFYRGPFFNGSGYDCALYIDLETTLFVSLDKIVSAKWNCISVCMNNMHSESSKADSWFWCMAHLLYLELFWYQDEKDKNDDRKSSQGKDTMLCGMGESDFEVCDVEESEAWELTEELDDEGVDGDARNTGKWARTAGGGREQLRSGVPNRSISPRRSARLAALHPRRSPRLASKESRVFYYGMC